MVLPNLQNDFEPIVSTVQVKELCFPNYLILRVTAWQLLFFLEKLKVFKLDLSADYSSVVKFSIRSVSEIKT